MEAVFVLRQVIAGIAHVAEVAVEAEPADEDQILVSPRAFGWLRDRYGPDAVLDRPINQQLAAEALEGAPTRSPTYRAATPAE
ncbi:hypothetical protein [Micromonospora sp. CPCC 205556]|uniref:hypothetical protein n=1 Tax=Micromonospora sp. CPCC 205556 TaxID=3122398 RepID=UPI002FF01547